MKQQLETPRFAHLQYSVLKQFDMSPAEYWYLDMVYYLSRDGWCHKSLENIASDMNMSKNGVIKLRDRLIAKKLIIKNRKGYVKSSVMYHKVYLTGENRTTKLQTRTTKWYSDVPQSSTKNNNETNIDHKGVENRGKGYEAARLIRSRLVGNR